MTITPPMPYSSVKKPVIFRFDRPLSSVCEVVVNGYRKLLPNDARQVNVADYFREDFDIFPCMDMNGVFEVRDGLTFSRVTEAYILIDGVRSDTVPLICADRQPSANRFMSDMRHRVIDRGEVDEIPVFLTTPALLEYGGESIPLGAGVIHIGFRVPQEAPEHFTIRLLTTEGEELDCLDYQIEPSSGVRMAWVNVYGALDFWTFQIRRKVATKITRENIYAEDGYIPTSIQAETTNTVCTQPLSEQVCSALSQIFTAEQVMIIENDHALSVDVTSDAVTIFEEEKPSSIQVEYRTKRRQL